jgi:hypothetical protein
VKTYIVTCRGVFDQAVIAKLEVLGVYWTQVSSAGNTPSQWIRHHLLIEAGSEDQAIQRARFAVEASGGPGTDYTCLGKFSEIGNPL